MDAGMLRSFAGRPEVATLRARARERGGLLAEEIARLCLIPAPTFEEGKRAEYVVARLRQAGCREVRVDERGNALGALGPEPSEVRGGSAAREGAARRGWTVLAAHLDTVFGPEVEIRVHRDGQRLYGPGIGDNCSNLAGMIALAELLASAPPELIGGPLLFAATIGEEGLGDLAGMRHLMRHLEGQVEQVIVLDGRLGGLVTEAVGSRRFKITCRGEGGHSWADFGRSSAIHGLAQLIARTTKLQVPRSPRTTFNFGLCQGGTSVNAIAETATAQLDLRSLGMDELLQLERNIRFLAHEVEIEADVTFEFELVGERPAGRIGARHRLPAIVRAVHRLLAIDTFEQALSTDANIPLSQGIPAVAIGITHGSDGHRISESIDLTPIPDGLEQFLLVTLAAALPGARRAAPARSEA